MLFRDMRQLTWRGVAPPKSCQSARVAGVATGMVEGHRDGFAGNCPRIYKAAHQRDLHHRDRSDSLHLLLARQARSDPCVDQPERFAGLAGDGFALGILLLRDYRVWPAIFVGAFLANVSSTGSIYASAAIALGNSLEAVVGALLINRLSGGIRTFTTPAGIAKFVLISAAATAISPAIGVSSLSVGGYAEWAGFGPIFVTWWLGDLAGALVVAPVFVLWADNPLTRVHAKETIAIFVVAAGITPVFR